jgi:hypothetical protein
MTDFTTLNSDAQKLIDAAVAAQKSNDDATIADLRAQLAAYEASSNTTPTPASVSDAAFSYSGTWNTASGEHWTSSVGAKATIKFTAATGGSTFSLRGVKDTSNGSVSVAFDGGTAVNVNEQGTNTPNATMYTSGVLAAGAHTAVVTVTGADGSITGADISNGTFTAPTTGSTGGTTTGGNTYGTGGSLIGGPASTSNASGYAPPTADAFSGYTQTISQDFNTAAAEGQFGSKYPGWNGYDGVQDGNVSGLTWQSAQISATSGVLTLRNTDKSHCQAFTPIIPGTGAWNTQAQLYGKYVIRMKSRGAKGFKIAFLLWPTDGNWNEGEVDFPEGNIIGGTMTANSHNVTGNPVDGDYSDSGVRIDDGNWHTLMTEWDPTSVKFSIDGKVFHTTTNTSYIPKNNMRWDLQVETSPDQSVAGTAYVDIDWVAQYKKN